MPRVPIQTIGNLSDYTNSFDTSPSYYPVRTINLGGGIQFVTTDPSGDIERLLNRDVEEEQKRRFNNIAKLVEQKIISSPQNVQRNKSLFNKLRDYVKNNKMVVAASVSASVLLLALGYTYADQIGINFRTLKNNVDILVNHHESIVSQAAEQVIKNNRQDIKTKEELKQEVLERLKYNIGELQGYSMEELANLRDFNFKKPGLINAFKSLFKMGTASQELTGKLRDAFDNHFKDKSFETLMNG